MSREQLKCKWLELINLMNSKGIPLPLIRLEGRATFSGTLAFISFNLWAISVIGKWAGRLGGINTSDCLQMFLACVGLYFGRKFQKDGNKTEIGDKVDKDEKTGS